MLPDAYLDGVCHATIRHSSYELKIQLTLCIHWVGAFADTKCWGQHANGCTKAVTMHLQAWVFESWIGAGIACKSRPDIIGLTDFAHFFLHLARSCEAGKYSLFKTPVLQEIREASKTSEYITHIKLEYKLLNISKQNRSVQFVMTLGLGTFPISVPYLWAQISEA